MIKLKFMFNVKDQSNANSRNNIMCINIQVTNHVFCVAMLLSPHQTLGDLESNGKHIVGQVPQPSEIHWKRSEDQDENWHC